jgi:ankyrin repeat protein
MKHKRRLPLRVNAYLFEDDAEGLKKYLKKTKKSIDMAWLLFAASSGGSPRILYWLLAEHDPNITHEFLGDGTTPLMWSALNNEPLTIQLLLDAGAEINRLDQWGSSALCNAAHHGANDVIALLLNRGADINLGHPLGSAAINGQLETVKLLLAAGAEINAIEKECDTALAQASFPGHTQVIAYLLEQGADINAHSHWTPLMTAAFHGQLKAVKLLAKAGANLALTDEEGKTAANLASEQGHDKIAKYLRKKKR